MGLIALFAQSGDPISGGAGWVGAGLLGAVLAWLLLVHLPGKDKQMRELLKDFRDETNAQRVSGETALKTVCATFEAEMQAERASCEKRIDAIIQYGKRI